MNAANTTATARRLEALVDGVTIVEGTTTAHARRRDEIVVQPDYVRAGVIDIDAAGYATVRPRGHRDAGDEATVTTLPRIIRIRPSEFCEIWLDGRLAHMSR